MVVITGESSVSCQNHKLCEYMIARCVQASIIHAWHPSSHNKRLVANVHLHNGAGGDPEELSGFCSLLPGGWHFVTT